MTNARTDASPTASPASPVACRLSCPTWEDPDRVVVVRQSDIDRARAVREAPGADVSNAEWDAAGEFLSRVYEQQRADEQWDSYHCEPPCVAKHA